MVKNNEAEKPWPWEIQDWAGNLTELGRFKTFDDAEEFLASYLGDDYEEARQEYYIIEAN